MNHFEIIEKERRNHQKHFQNSIAGNPCGRGFFPCDMNCDLCKSKKQTYDQTIQTNFPYFINSASKNPKDLHKKSLQSNNIFSENKPREECGVFGVVSRDPTIHVAQICFNGLIALQHRGQEAAGLTVVDTKKNIYTYKDLGLVTEAIPLNILARLWGHASIGHVRYGTAGSASIENAQPFHFKANNTEFSIAFNGNITNYKSLKSQLIKQGRLFFSDSDTEVIAQIIARNTNITNDWVENIQMTASQLDGSYALVILTKEGNIYAIRDPFGMKPLVFGKAKFFETDLLLIASESCAFESLDGFIVRDIKPGEIVFFNKDHDLTSKTIIENPLKRLYHCMFEYVYFARPDSVIDGKSVYMVRETLGRKLALMDKNESDENLDKNNAIVVPIPDSGKAAAIGYSLESKIPYFEGLMKNRYIYRTFITPDQNKRLNLVRMKLNPIRAIVEGKEIILVDDSIVRGTTIGKLIDSLKNASAKKVHVRISCPPVIFPCYFGVDFPTSKELYASRAEALSKGQESYIEAIQKEIGADSLKYQTLEALNESIGLGNNAICEACLNHDYPARFQETLDSFGKGRL